MFTIMARDFALQAKACGRAGDVDAMKFWIDADGELTLQQVVAALGFKVGIGTYSWLIEEKDWQHELRTIAVAGVAYAYPEGLTEVLVDELVDYPRGAQPLLFCQAKGRFGSELVGLYLTMLAMEGSDAAVAFMKVVDALKLMANGNNRFARFFHNVSRESCTPSLMTYKQMVKIVEEGP